MFRFAERRVPAHALDDVVSDAFVIFAQRVDWSRVDRELVSFALYCVRHRIAEYFRGVARRVELVFVSDVPVVPVVGGQVDFEVSASLEALLDVQQLRLVSLLMDGHCLVHAGEMMGLSKTQSYRLRDSVRDVLGGGVLV